MSYGSIIGWDSQVHMVSMMRAIRLIVGEQNLDYRAMSTMAVMDVSIHPIML